MHHLCRLPILVLMILVAGPSIAQHKGSVKPNWGLADFTKHDEAYYLSLDQIQIGWTEDQVAEEFGKKYKSSESVGPDGKTHRTWRFASYRARMLSDPVDSIVTVEFVDGLVAGAKQVPAPGSDVILGGCTGFCVNGVSLTRLHPLFELDRKAIQRCFPVADGHRPLLADVA